MVPLLSQIPENRHGRLHWFWLLWWFGFSSRTDVLYDKPARAVQRISNLIYVR